MEPLHTADGNVHYTVQWKTVRQPLKSRTIMMQQSQFWIYTCKRIESRDKRRDLFKAALCRAHTTATTTQMSTNKWKDKQNVIFKVNSAQFKRCKILTHATDTPWKTVQMKQPHLKANITGILCAYEVAKVVKCTETENGDCHMQVVQRTGVTI